MAERTLNHFAFFSYRDAFRSLDLTARHTFNQEFLRELRQAAMSVQVYQVYPTRADADFLIWSALPADANEAAGRFFECFGRTAAARGGYLQPSTTLWGFTKPSQYARGQSAQEIDPFAAERLPYLIAYPFVKTVDWYLMSRHARQGMMNEHMRVGHQYPEIKQLLLYSFGLQEQEFVVVYETEDLVKFSDLVYELRGVDGRRYTLRDTPTYTAVYHAAEETLGMFE